MKKALKLIGIAVLILLMLQVTIRYTARHGWKLLGFELCESPDVLYTGNVFVTDDKVYISGGTASSASFYVGYTCKISDNILYVGIKQNLLLGSDGRSGNYSFNIEGDFENLKSVYIVGGDKEKCIWTSEADKKYMEKIQNIRLYRDVTVSAENDYAQEMKTAEFVYADDVLLYKIQHPSFSYDICITKGGTYLGVAELADGNEMYLWFGRHYDYYGIIGEWGYYEY